MRTLAALAGLITVAVSVADLAASAQESDAGAADGPSNTFMVTGARVAQGMATAQLRPVVGQSRTWTTKREAKGTWTMERKLTRSPPPQRRPVIALSSSIM